MKTLFVFALAFLYLCGEAQNISIPYEGDCVGKQKTTDLELTLSNGSLHLSGILPGNCCGENFLTYNSIANPFVLTVDHSGQYCYCICDYSFDHVFQGFTTDSLHIIIEPRILDTVIYKTLNLHNISSVQHKAVCYPVPAKENITITFPNSEQQNFEMRIYDQTGKMVMSKKDITNERIFLNVSELNRGAYIYTILSDKRFYTGQMLFY